MNPQPAAVQTAVQPAATLLTSNAELIAALRSTLVPDARVRLVVAAPPQLARPTPVSVLPSEARPRRGWTTRETEVVRLLADGLSTTVIARQMNYSERTIKGIVHQLTERLQLRNRTHLVAYAIRQDLL